MSSIPYFSTRVADDLLVRIEENAPRYLKGDFHAEIAEPGATLELPIECDLAALSSLSASDGDLANAKVVWTALHRLTPSLACENRIWTRLCHGECLGYARERWLGVAKEPDLLKLARIHMFATTQTMYRDDNAVGRLWWSAYVAHKSDPGDFEGALGLILKSADIRSNFVERTWMTTRPVVASSLLALMKEDPWVTALEVNFRETMKALNVDGAGLVFEAMAPGRTRELISASIEKAKQALQTTST